jgi:CTP:molybdopterin cytidylyltransferase MocA
VRQGLRHRRPLALGAAAAQAPSWQTAVGAEPEEWFSFPYVGAPWHHECSSLRSRRATVSVVVPVWNSEQTIERCLDAVGRSSLNRLAPSRLEVVVCDDGSTDASRQRVALARRDVDVAALRLTHRGQSAALNAGLERASGDVVVFCDSDMVLGCGALDELAARHERWSDVVCFGFHSNIPPAAVDASATWSLMHLEAFSRDPRVRFYLPTLVPNLLDSSDWLSRLHSGRFMLDSRGGVWRRHRFLFGCLFSVRRELILENDAFPDILNGWGLNDVLVAARLEAAGACLLPVASAWGHHIEHPVRPPDRWFQLSRNDLAYRELLERPPRREDWRVAAETELVESTFLRRRDEAPTDQPAAIDHDAAAFAALGKWSECLERAQAEGNDQLVSETLFRLGRYDEETSCGGRDTVWRALSHHRLGHRERARSALEDAAMYDETGAYALAASAPELERLSRHYVEQEMPDVARLYEEVAEIIAGHARVGHGVRRASPASERPDRTRTRT